MTRIIINNHTDCPDFVVLEAVAKIVADGRTSNSKTQYCYAIVFKYNNKQYAITSDLNKKSDRFTVVEYEKNNV